MKTNNELKTEVDKIIALFKQPSFFKVLLRRINGCDDILLQSNATIFLEKLLNKMISGCREDKLFYNVVTKLSKNVDEDKLRMIYKRYAVCMIQKWDCDYKFVMFVKRRFNDILHGEESAISDFIKDKAVLRRILE